MDIKEFCELHNIPYQEEGTKHCRPGWVQMHCPFCHDGRSEHWHLGYNLTGQYFNCWKCGPHNKEETIKEFTGWSWAKSKAFVKKEMRNVSFKKGKIKEQVTEAKEMVGMPKNPVSAECVAYLRKRDFNIRDIVNAWGPLFFGGVVGEYQRRLILPIQYDKKIVSFTSRDITGHNVNTYKTCPKDKELLHNKDILYGIDQAMKNTCIVVEGIFDAWRIGPGAVATFGVGYTKKQLILLHKKFKNIYILFDNDAAGREKGISLENDLLFLRANVKRLRLPTMRNDPGSLLDDEARIYKAILRKA